MASAGIAGSAKISGTVNTAGPGHNMNQSTAHPAVKRAILFWGIAVVTLFIFHVGGASFE